MIEIKRDDLQYLEVEKFKEYELTHCIAYEMAIRNEKVINLIIKGFTEYLDKDLNEPLNAPTLEELGKTSHSEKYFKELRDTYFMPQGLYLKYHFFSDIWKRIEALIKQNARDSKELERLSNKIQNEDITKEEWDWFTNRKDIRMLGSLIFEKKIAYFKYDDKIQNENYHTLEHHTPTYYERLYYINGEKEEKITAQIIEPNYSRPKLTSFHKVTERDIRINLSMPKNELIDFICKVKEDYDKSPKLNTIKSISELLGEEKLPFKDLVYNKKEVPLLDRKTKKEIKATSFTSNSSKMADILYIYDCLKLGYSKINIIYELSRYHNKDTALDDDTYRRYVSISKDFIDRQRYKELFLGSSL